MGTDPLQIQMVNHWTKLQINKGSVSSDLDMEGKPFPSTPPNTPHKKLWQKGMWHRPVRVRLPNADGTPTGPPAGVFKDEWLSLDPCRLDTHTTAARAFNKLCTQRSFAKALANHPVRDWAARLSKALLKCRPRALLPTTQTTPTLQKRRLPVTRHPSLPEK